MNDCEGLSALVTGGASGIGAATVHELASRGAKVAVLDRDIAALSGNDLAFTADLSDVTAVQDGVTAAAHALGGIDILINNAGIGASGAIDANDDDEWRRVLDINVIGIARVTRFALPLLRQSSAAAIVNSCSAVAFLGVRDRALYSASKGAVAGLTLAMAADHVSEGIRVNAVAPGTVDTPWVGRLLSDADSPDAAAEALRKRQPIGRLVSAEEVAFTITNLASPRAGSTTGTIVGVDGGMVSLRI